MLKITFGDDTFDTERRLMGELKGLCLGIITDDDQTTADDVVYRGVNADGDYVFQAFDEESGEGHGPAIPVDPVDLLHVHVY